MKFIEYGGAENVRVADGDLTGYAKPTEFWLAVGMIFSWVLPTCEVAAVPLQPKGKQVCGL